MRQLEIIANNPLRVLGVYVGDSMAQEVNNMSRIAAYSEVGKTAEFSLRGDDRLPPLQRTKEMAANARQRLTLPNDRLRYALFWYGTPENIELNKAVDAMVEGRQSDALVHYIAMINDEGQYHSFLQAATHGLLSPSKDTLLSVLLHALEEMDELPSLLRKRTCVTYSLLRPSAEAAGRFLHGIRSVYGPGDLRYAGYLQTAVVNLCDSGKFFDETLDSDQISSSAQLDLHWEASEAAHAYIVDTVNSWMTEADAAMRDMAVSFMAPYEKYHSDMPALVSEKRRKIWHKKAKRIHLTVLWLIVLILILYLTQKNH